jgi:chromosome segregation ATPase
MSAIDTALVQIRADYAAKHAHIESLEKELKTVKDEYAAFKLASFESDSETINVQKKLNELETELADANAKLDFSKKNHAMFTKAIQERDEKCEASRIKADEYYTQLMSARKQLEARQTEATVETDLRQVVQNQETKIDVLKRELIKLSEKNIRLMDVNQSLAANNIASEQLAREKQAHETTHREVTQVVKDYEAIIEDYKDQVNELAARVIEQSDRANHWSLKYDHEVEVYETLLRTLRTDIDALKMKRAADKEVAEQAVILLHRTIFRDRTQVQLQPQVSLEEVDDNISESEDEI